VKIKYLQKTAGVSGQIILTVILCNDAQGMPSILKMDFNLVEFGFNVYFLVSEYDRRAGQRRFLIHVQFKFVFCLQHAGLLNTICTAADASCPFSAT
jgi:hypothetical protein